MVIDKLTNENFLIYAAKHYDHSQCYNDEEFQEDLKRFRYIKKLLTRYEETGKLKERLILNHLIILNNVFGPKHLVKMLFLKNEGQLHLLKPFLVLLNILPDKIYNVGNKDVIFTDTIPMDTNIIDLLRKI